MVGASLRGSTHLGQMTVPSLAGPVLIATRVFGAERAARRGSILGS